MGKSSKTETTNTALQPFLSSYENLLGQAQGTAANAQFNPQQLQAFGLFGNIAGSTGDAAAQPYIDSAQNYFGDATSPFSQAALQPYMDPYTNDVVNATQNQFDLQNAQAQTGLEGNMAAAGAFGGDRSAVMQSQLAGQQQTAQAPVIAGLENQGYQTALGQYNADKQNDLAAAFGEGNLGSEVQGLDLAGASALEQSGATQTAFPMQTEQWLAQMETGLGGAAGSQSTTEQEQPFLSQLMGGLESGAGLIGSTGGFGSSGWLSNMFSGGSGYGTGLGTPGFTPGTDPQLLGFERGGGIVVPFPRQHRGIGGPLNSDIPLTGLRIIDPPKASSTPPPSSSGGGGGGIMKLASAAIPFLSRGGIAGYADGGDTQDDDDDIPDKPPGWSVLGDQTPAIATAAPAHSDPGTFHTDYKPLSIPSHYAEDESRAPWQALMAAGLATLSSGNIGTGGLKGMEMFNQLHHQDEEGQQTGAVQQNESEYRKASLDKDVFDINQRAAQAKAALTQTTAHETAEQNRWQQEENDKAADLATRRQESGLDPVPSAAQGATPGLASFAQKMTALENSTGNPAAKNPNSSATGNGQFIDSTWLNMLHTVNPQIAQSLTPQQQLSLRSDPAFSTEMTEKYAEQNAHILAGQGLPVTNTTLALAHRFGPQGATQLFHADPTAPVASILPAPVIAANPQLRNQTVGQYIQQLSAKIGNDPVQAAPSTFIPKAMQGKPTLIEGTGADGQSQQVLAQQDMRTGQWVTADQNRSPVNLQNMHEVTPSAGQGGRAQVYFNRVVAAGNEAAASARNIMELPTTASTGIFGGRQQGSGLLEAAKESLTNTVTSQGVQDYNTMIAGVSRNLAAIEASGLAPAGSLMHSMDAVTLKEGDSDLTKLRKMAEMRQIVEMGLSPNLSNPLIPKEQKTLVSNIIGQMQSAIPFTQHDVTMLELSNNPQATIMDFAKKSKLGGSGNGPSAPAIQYLKAHPDQAALFDQKYGAGASKQYMSGP